MEGIVVLSYHKNAKTLYPKEWLDCYVDSITSQTVQPSRIIEINYGGTEFQLFPHSEFYSMPSDNFVNILNTLLSLARAYGFPYIFNSNVDDYYSPFWIEKQLVYLKEYDLVSCNFTLVQNEKETIKHRFHTMDIQKELSRDNNIIAHPSVCYRSSFFDDLYYDPNQIPKEDLLLWKRAIVTKKFKIVEENLLWHRVHNQSICNSDNR